MLGAVNFHCLAGLFFFFFYLPTLELKKYPWQLEKSVIVLQLLILYCNEDSQMFTVKVTVAELEGRVHRT